MSFVSTWKVESKASTLLEAVNFASQMRSLDEVSSHLPDGAYTTFRTFDRRSVLHLQRHFRRLEETARLAGYPQVLDENLIRLALRQAIAWTVNGDVRVRITLALGTGGGDVYISVEPLHLPSEADYIQGVKVITRCMQRTNPKAKLTTFIQTADRIRHEMPEDVNETLMLDENGCVLEGLSSNFFAIWQGKLWTAEEGVLSGITRSLVLEEADRMGLPIHYRSVAKADLSRVDEAFITSASRAVLPVVQIDQQVVGGGQPGILTLRLLKHYRERIDREVEPI